MASFVKGVFPPARPQPQGLLRRTLVKAGGLQGPPETSNPIGHVLYLVPWDQPLEGGVVWATVPLHEIAIVLLGAGALW